MKDLQGRDLFLKGITGESMVDPNVRIAGVEFTNPIVVGSAAPTIVKP